MAKDKAKKSSKKSRKKIKVAIIGAGGRAVSTHYPALDAMPDVTIAAVCELNAERMNKVADQFHIEGRFSNYREMIEKTAPDAVYAIMPPHHLYDVAATCMEMKQNVFIEKPPAVTTEQTRQMAILAEKHGCLTGVTFQRRFSPTLKEAKRLCEERGPIHSCVATFYKNAMGAGPYYKGALDILSCDAIHAVDTLRWMAGGNVLSVASDVRRLLAAHYTSHLALATFDSGATGVLLTNWMTGRRFFTVEMHAPGISAFVDPEEGGTMYADGKLEPMCKLDPAEIGGGPEPWRAYGGYDTNRHFMDCIKSGKQPQTNFEDAVKTMELVDSIYAGQI